MIILCLIVLKNDKQHIFFYFFDTIINGIALFFRLSMVDV